MAHWAEIDENNIVVRVIKGEDDQHDWLVETLGGRWVQTSYNTWAGQHLLGGTPLRGNYASTGYIYDEQLDAFISPKPSETAVLDEVTFQWVEPDA